jgi:putative sigma-54 modulation protein
MSMPIFHISGKNLDLTTSIKDDVINKFNKLERHFNNIVSIHVTLSHERIDHHQQFTAKAHFAIPLGDITADASSEDMYASIDILIDKLDKQLVKHKEKLKK